MKRKARLASKHVKPSKDVIGHCKDIRMGTNLGFIEKIILTDGTVLKNMHVLYRAPIPNEEQLDMMFCVANKILHQVIGPANFNWSDYPETMKGSLIFQDGFQV
jgi:hypothetical protein